MIQRYRIGIVIPQAYKWPELVEHVCLVESLGFESVWLTDRFAAFGNFGPEWLEAWTALAGLAALTTKIRLGILVSTITYRNPAVIAAQAMTVDGISGGRLNIGMGAGGTVSSHAMTGVPLWEPVERSHRFREYVEIVHGCLSNRHFSYDGQYYTVDSAHFAPGPVQIPRPPITIAAHGSNALKVAGKYAERWSFFKPGPRSSFQDALANVERWGKLLDSAAIQAGRSPANIVRSLCCGFARHTDIISLDDLSNLISSYEGVGVGEFVLPYAPSIEAGSFLSTEERLIEFSERLE